MFKKLIDALKDMWDERREACYIALGYVLFMLAFFFIGITKARFETVAALALLTGLYALGVWLVKKI